MLPKIIGACFHLCDVYQGRDLAIAWLCAACTAHEGLYGAIARWRNCRAVFKMLTFTSGFSMVRVKAKEESA